jgi:hypothetical protein
MNCLRTLWISVFFISVNCILIGQEFNNVYDHNFHQSSGAAIVEIDSSYVGFSLGAPSFGLSSVVVSEYNKNDGQLLRQTVLSDSTVSYYLDYHFEVFREDSLLTYITFASNLESLIIIQYNIYTKEILQNKISLKNEIGKIFFIDDVKKINEQYFVFVTAVLKTSDNNNRLTGILKVNKDLTYNFKFYGDYVSNEHVLGSKAAITSDEMIIVGFSEYELRRKYNLPSSVYFVKINKKGDVIWKGKDLFDSEKLVLNNGNICTLNDSILFISGLKYNINTNEYPYIFFTKVMLIYDIKNDKILKRVLFPKAYENENPFPHSMIKKTHDNCILFGGGQSLIKGNIEEEDYLAGSLGKMDSNGNLLFYNSYLHFIVDSIGEYNDTRITDIEETSEGDILCYGGAYYERHYTWLLKTDKDGIVKKLNVNSVTAPVDIYKSNLVLYPNPCGNFISIDYSGLYSAKSIILLDFFGNICQTFPTPNYETQFITCDISSLPEGIYIVNLIDQNGRSLSSEKFIKQH